MKPSAFSIFAVCFIILVSCLLSPTVGGSSPAEPKYKTLQDVPQATWDKLAQQKIFFGHHSVGENILEGVARILKEHPNIKLNIRHARKNDKIIHRAGLVEGPVGQNFYPMTKLNAFKDKVEGGYGESADIAFFKFCFVDFNPETDINALFESFTTTMASLNRQYPNTDFPIVTAPLTCYAPGLSGLVKRTKDLIKKIIGKLNVYDYTSANRFNELLAQEYSGTYPVFDLARYESTRPDGTRVVQETNGRKNFELVQEYTTDGGHLNSEGKQVIAEQFLLFLAEQADGRP